MKRIITGHDEEGRSVFSSVGESQRVVDFGLGKLIEMWATDETVSIPDDEVDPETKMESFVPSPGGTRFRIFTIEPSPPDQVPTSEQVEGLFQLLAAQAPGLAQTLESDNLGMHTTETIDYVVALSGEADLELDEGETIRVVAGDCVVQRGTRHAWRNTGNETFVAAAIMVGAKRQ